MWSGFDLIESTMSFTWLKGWIKWALSLSESYSCFQFCWRFSKVLSFMLIRKFEAMQNIQSIVIMILNYYFVHIGTSISAEHSFVHKTWFHNQQYIRNIHIKTGKIWFNCSRMYVANLDRFPLISLCITSQHRDSSNSFPLIWRNRMCYKNCLSFQNWSFPRTSRSDDKRSH